jgi:hypothetical protein
LLTLFGIAKLSSRTLENSKGVTNLGRSPKLWSFFNDDHRADANPEVAGDEDGGAEIEPLMKNVAGACSIARRRKKTKTTHKYCPRHCHCHCHCAATHPVFDAGRIMMLVASY